MSLVARNLNKSTMAFKIVALLSVLAVANAGLIAEHGVLAPAAITSGHMNILRSPGNLGQVSTYSKTIDTPFSSVSKHDVRVSNPGVAVHAAYAAPAHYAAPAYAAPAHYAAPAYAAQAYAAPAAHYAPAPVAYAAPVAKIAAPVAYAAPVAKIAAPVAYATPAYSAPAYAAPAYSHGYAAPIAKVAAAPALLGVAYSAAPAVSHMTYSNNLGLAYEW